MATLKERLDSEIKDAMRAKDELKLGVLRMLKSAIEYKEVEGEKHLLDDAGRTSVRTTQRSISTFGSASAFSSASKMLVPPPSAIFSAFSTSMAVSTASVPTAVVTRIEIRD